MQKNIIGSSIKGYKATNKDMVCRDYQFSIGNFHHKGEVEPCESGFHFCEKLEDVFNYYHTDCRVFEVIGSGTVVKCGDKVVCSDIEFVREINYADYVDHKNRSVRSCVAYNKCGLDKLVHDKELSVKYAVAKVGIPKYMDILINDPSPPIRQQIAANKYKLDVLVNDVSSYVRQTVALQGYGLDKLINDESYIVRLTVADLGYGLDKLISDTNAYVRASVANQGYGIDILINDENKHVRYVATEYKRKQDARKFQ